MLPHDAAAVAYDTIVRFMRLGLRTILMLALVVAAGAFLTGGSVTAVRTRQGLAGAIAWLQGSAEHAGLRTRPVGVWVGANKRALRIGAVTLACLALVFWGRPTGKVVLGLTLALLVVLALIEFLGRPASHDAGQTVHDHLEGQDGHPNSPLTTPSVTAVGQPRRWRSSSSFV